MAKGNGSTRASSSSRPRGLQSQSGESVGYGGLTFEEVTNTADERNAYINRNWDRESAISAIELGGEFSVGNINVSVLKGEEDEDGYADIGFEVTDSYGNGHTFGGGSYNVYSQLGEAAQEARACVLQFLYDYPQRKR